MSTGKGNKDNKIHLPKKGYMVECSFDEDMRGFRGTFVTENSFDII